ncbi:MAG: hypothetical protein ACPGVY_15785, partial [Mycobacterium sp.]
MIKPRKHRIKTPVMSVRILPSAMTVAAICFGLSSVKFALEGRSTEAMAFLAIAAILDASVRVRTGNYVPVSQRNPEVPYTLETIVDRALRADREHRTPDCAT